MAGIAAEGAVYPMRPHHALCLAFFIGKGYGAEFVAGMADVERELAADPDARVRLVDGTDRICSKCPHNRGGVCESAEKTARYDSACLAACGLSTGRVVPWGELRRRVKENILSEPGGREKICGDCQWDAVCRQAEPARAARRGEKRK